jgi:hypothetical protein
MARDSGKQNKGQSLLGAMPSIPPGQSFTNAFLATIAAVDGQSFAAFNPQANPLHAALEYAHKNGGKGHTVTAAMEKLHKAVVNPKTTAEQKEAAREMIRQLSQFSGAVAVYPPKLGAFFRHKPDQELFQEDKEARRSEAAKKMDAASREADRLFKAYEALQEEYISALGNAPRGEKTRLKREYDPRLDEANKAHNKAAREAQRLYSALADELTSAWGRATTNRGDWKAFLASEIRR